MSEDGAAPTAGRHSSGRDNATRTKARKRALDILFESDLRERPTAETLGERVALAEPPVRAFTIELVNGVVDHADELDALLASCLREGWTVPRMNRVDRNLARIALFEMAHTDTPAQVAISEAVGLASALSTDESPAFLNAVLAAAVGRLTRPATDDEEQQPHG